MDKKGKTVVSVEGETVVPVNKIDAERGVMREGQDTFDDLKDFLFEEYRAAHGCYPLVVGGIPRCFTPPQKAQPAS
jgi:hypothetical protein